MNIEPLRDWMLERQKIYQRRIAGEPPPWTDDEVLNNYRFCNVYREQDTVTQWIDRNIRQPYANHKTLWLMLAIARIINRTDTLAELIGTNAWPNHVAFTPSKLAHALDARAARGVPIYTGAYMIRAESNPKQEWYYWSKQQYIAHIVIGRLWDDKHLWRGTLERAQQGKVGMKFVWDSLRLPRYIGWGPFMSYELVTDLRHTRYLCNAPDIYSWANAGPGALRGLNRLNDRPLTQGIPANEANREMQELMQELNELDEPEFNRVFGPPEGCRGAQRPRFEMRDIEHSLCETDKWLRVKNGEGRPRSKYDPNKATILQ